MPYAHRAIAESLRLCNACLFEEIPVETQMTNQQDILQDSAM